jgi:hypothetical protein
MWYSATPHVRAGVLQVPKHPSRPPLPMANYKCRKGMILAIGNDGTAPQSLDDLLPSHCDPAKHQTRSSRYHPSHFRLRPEVYFGL